MKLWVCVLLLAVSAAHGRSLLEADSDGCAGDDNCGRRISPKYEVLGHEGATEIREYENDKKVARGETKVCCVATWATSFGRSIFGVDIAAAVATKGIFAYFAGFNNEHKRIPPSVPLIATILKKPHPHGPKPPKNGSHPEHPHNGSHHHHPHPHPPRGTVVTVTAFVTSKKGEAPKPDEHGVKLHTVNATKVYSHGFGGFAISWFVKKEIKHLKTDLKALGLKPCKGRFFVATYNGPWKLFGRKNEVWWTEIPKHSKSDDMSERIGFDQFDPLYSFPEEGHPPEPEGPAKELPFPEEVAPEELIQFKPGQWVTETGRSNADEVIQL